MSRILDDESDEYKPTHIVRDRDSKFTRQFCSILKDGGTEFREVVCQSPNVNPFAEAWVQRAKRECFDWLIVFDEPHLRHIFSCWLSYYHIQRVHQGLGNVPITADLSPARTIGGVSSRRGRLPSITWGLLKHYEQRVA